ncbi:MAG: hypothetical protein C4520_10640 [Candidatus Abyssobacteria bacterium SURF_5]|uniref:Uncharacterized protein n=1 Tax=Abyssobacteria bacterium (strain SURF_5) TaxID=2093360 RepID=A0A3A4NYT4_ABYX5|nr:MAG: hypothetical protein C4520_10640 [Candidatus Abyssubacteria bacterium SURF_5]
MVGLGLIFKDLLPFFSLLIMAVIIFSAIQMIPGIKKFRRWVAPAIASVGLVLMITGRNAGLILLLFGMAMIITDFAVPDSFTGNDEK